nr:MAG TPA: hypothetical protein [Caudoviricetes sp.]
MTTQQGWLSKALRRAHNREFVESMTPYWWGRWYITRPCISVADLSSA